MDGRRQAVAPLTSNIVPKVSPSGDAKERNLVTRFLCRPQSFVVAYFLGLESSSEVYLP